MKTLDIQLSLPPRGCATNGNRSLHWSKRNEAVDSYRQEGWDVARNTAKHFGYQSWAKKVKVSWTFCTQGSRVLNKKFYNEGYPDHLLLYSPMDDDNALSSVKAARDGIANALHIPDDSKHWQTAGITIDKTRGPYVLVHIEEAS